METPDENKETETTCKYCGCKIPAYKYCCDDCYAIMDADPEELAAYNRHRYGASYGATDD